MAKGIIWATAEDLARNRGRVISLYRQILRSLNSPNLPLSFAARLAKKAEVRAIFMLASEERSLHNIEDLIDTAEGMGTAANSVGFHCSKQVIFDISVVDKTYIAF
ncbi:hypothetical protein Csa_006466 [Cucumis sativus]|nr:hypothetical protein Csa_006466 [Cucumis sativus]